MAESLPVIFRMDRRKDGEVTAVFPTLPADARGTLMTCYAHVGQHGGAGWTWYLGNTHRPATPAEYADLLAELTAIYGTSHAPGDPVYTLKPVRKLTRAHRKAFDAEVRRLNRAC